MAKFRDSGATEAQLSTVEASVRQPPPPAAAAANPSWRTDMNRIIWMGIGVAIGVIFLGDTLSATAWAGLVLVVAGVAAMTLPAKRSAAREEVVVPGERGRAALDERQPVLGRD